MVIYHIFPAVVSVSYLFQSSQLVRIIYPFSLYTSAFITDQLFHLSLHQGWLCARSEQVGKQSVRTAETYQIPLYIVSIRQELSKFICKYQ